MLVCNFSFAQSSENINRAKKQCEELGFKKDTDQFLNCTLQLLKKMESEKEDDDYERSLLRKKRNERRLQEEKDLESCKEEKRSKHLEAAQCFADCITSRDPSCNIYCYGFQRKIKPCE